MKNQKTYPQDHPYHKDANAFIRGLKKKKALMAEYESILKPVYDKFGAKHQWEVPGEYWRSLEWISSAMKMQVREINAKIIRLNSRLDKLKWGYWAVEPNGERWGEIYPEQFAHKQEMKKKREEVAQ